MSLPVVAGSAGVALGPAYVLLQSAMEAASINSCAQFFSAEIKNFGVEFLGFEPGKDLADYSLSELTSALYITNSASGTSASSVEGLNYLMEVASRGVDAVEQLKLKWESDKYDSAGPELDAGIASMNETEAAVFKGSKAADNLNKKDLTQAAKNALNKATRKSHDGKLVSKEAHEYRYCLSSGQIQEVYTAGMVQAPPELRYGAFVESKLMRKAIELLRRLRRVTHAKNSKELAEIMGTTPGALYLTLRDDLANLPTWQAAAAEFDSFSNLGG